MADEPEPTPTPAEPVAPAPDATPAEPRPHPLEPGGVRFQEVVEEKNRARAEADALRAQVQALTTAAARPTAAPPAAPRVWSGAELQALVDAGRITPAQMAEQLDLQAEQRVEHRLEQRLTQRQIVQQAQQEVRQYLEKIPALNQTGSPEFARVAAAAWDLSQETGWDVSDPRIQRRALREAFGALDRIETVRRAQDVSRREAEQHAEPGGPGAPAPLPGKGDPLAHVHPDYLAYWKSRGYTREQMIAEAKYVSKPFPGYVEKIHGPLMRKSG